MRHPCRGAIRQKLLSFAVLLVVLCEILQPIATRGLPPLSAVLTNNNNLNYSRTIYASNGSSPQSVKLGDIEMEKGDGTWDQNQQSYILVVVRQSLTNVGVVALEREFHDFVKLFFLEQFREEDDDFDELHQRIQFRRWQGE